MSTALLREELSTIEKVEPHIAPKFLTKTNNNGWVEKEIKETRAKTYDNVIVGFDGSLMSHKALNWGVNYAQAFHTKLVIVMGKEAIRREDNVVAPHIWNTQFKHMLQQDLDYVINKSIGTYPNIEVEKIIAFGEPEYILEEFSQGALLLIIGHKGQNGQGMKSFMGSVATYCIQNAACPVLVYREKTYRFQSSNFAESMIEWVA